MIKYKRQQPNRGIVHQNRLAERGAAHFPYFSRLHFLQSIADESTTLEQNPFIIFFFIFLSPHLKKNISFNIIKGFCSSVVLSSAILCGNVGAMREVTVDNVRDCIGGVSESDISALTEAASKAKLGS